MVFERISLLRNIGQFDSVNAGAQLPLTKLSLLYAENGRGKTTIAAVLRSLNTGEPGLIDERRRLGAANPPHVVLTFAGAPLVFQNGAWAAPLPRIAVFDDAFVAANVCSGIAIETAHRQNLHELILGAQGVALNATLQGHVARVEEHNRDLRTKGDAIPAAARGTLTIDAFCALAADSAIDAKIQEAERNLAAALSADVIRQRAAFIPFSLPGFDVATIHALLARNLPDLDAGAAARVREHLRSLGKGGEAWVGEGMGRIAGASKGKDHDACPFCAQDLAGSVLIQHYQAYFSEAYEALKTAIREIGQGINTAHAGDVPAAFERAVRVAVENREFWRAFTDVPDIDVDTAAIARAWATARDAVLTILRAKATAPLEAMTLSAETIAAIDAYDVHRTAIAGLSAALQARNAPIAIVKEQAAAAHVATDAATAALCDDTLTRKRQKRLPKPGVCRHARRSTSTARTSFPPTKRRSMNTSGGLTPASGSARSRRSTIAAAPRPTTRCLSITSRSH